MNVLRFSLCAPVLVATAHAAQFLTVEQAQRELFPAADSLQEKKLELSSEQLSQIESRFEFVCPLGISQVSHIGGGLDSVRQ